MQSADRQRGTEVGNRPVGVPPAIRHGQGGRATKAPDGLKTQKDVKNRGNELKDL